MTELTKIITEAANMKTPIEKFYANRPFLFFLTEELSGQVLFAGVIHDPTKG